MSAAEGKPAYNRGKADIDTLTAGIRPVADVARNWLGRLGIARTGLIDERPQSNKGAVATVRRGGGSCARKASTASRPARSTGGTRARPPGPEPVAGVDQDT